MCIASYQRIMSIWQEDISLWFKQMSWILAAGLVFGAAASAGQARLHAGRPGRAA